MEDNEATLVAEKDKEIAALKAEIEELKTAKHVCKRCGRSDMTAKLQVKEDVLKSYFRAMLGQQPFKQVLKAFDGKFIIEFTLQRGDVLSAEVKSTKAEDSTATANRIMMSTLSSVSIVDPERGINKDLYKANAEELLEAVTNYSAYYDRLVKSVDALQLGVIRQASALFNLLIMQLMNEVTSEGFYEGAGLD